MLRWFRVQAPPVALAVMFSLAMLGGSMVSPHEDDCHGVCGLVAVQHDASAHSIGGPCTSTDAQPLHCLACHFARSFRPHVETRLLSTPVIEAGATVHVDFFPVARRAQVAQPPLRSPPTPPLDA